MLLPLSISFSSLKQRHAGPQRHPRPSELKKLLAYGRPPTWSYSLSRPGWIQRSCDLFAICPQAGGLQLASSFFCSFGPFGCPSFLVGKLEQRELSTKWCTRIAGRTRCVCKNWICVFTMYGPLMQQFCFFFLSGLIISYAHVDHPYKLRQA